MESPQAGVQIQVMDQLIQGCKSAAELQMILRELNSLGHDRSITAEDLLRKILRSFAEAISKLSSIDSGEIPARSTYEGFEDSRTNSTNNDGRKRPAKQRRNMQETCAWTWTKITSVPDDEDGFTWQKYGQKKILNAKYPRSYFRCAYKDDIGCQAIKRIERIKDNPPMFRTKYIGYHTCQGLFKASFVESTDKDGLLINFASNTTTKQEPVILSSSFLSSEEEYKQMFTSQEKEYSPSSSLGYLPPQDSINLKLLMAASTSSSSTLDHDFVSGSHISSPAGGFDIDMELWNLFI